MKVLKQVEVIIRRELFRLMLYLGRKSVKLVIADEKFELE